ncbi:hypothetical protein NXV59_00020 [Bacteroides fragilis]|nr:hypothetical protein [Bacteroides fragilis]
MGYYQRDLTGYGRDLSIAENRNFGKQCINRHTFNQNSPETMMVHAGKSEGHCIYKTGKWKKKVHTKPEDSRPGAYAA